MVDLDVSAVFSIHNYKQIGEFFEGILIPQVIPRTLSDTKL